MAHILLSYQHDYRDIVVKIRNALKSRGFKTWLDEDDLKGPLLEGMENGVEKAFVVIMCMSSSYRNSDYCKKEIGYAERMKKPIIPIRVQADYEPDGWVGISSRSEIVADFRHRWKFEDPFARLIWELKKQEIKRSTDKDDEGDDDEGPSADVDCEDDDDEDEKERENEDGKDGENEVDKVGENKNDNDGENKNDNDGENEDDEDGETEDVG